MDFSNITKEYIRNHKFDSDGISYQDDTKNLSYRLRKDDAIAVNLAQSSTKLRKEFLNLFHSRFDGNFKKLEYHTGITEDAMRKYLRKEKGRNISRMAIAKMSVGIPLSIDEADKLFRLEGHSLEPESSLLDAIVVDALKCKDTIDVFYETCADFKIKT